MVDLIEPFNKLLIELGALHNALPTLPQIQLIFSIIVTILTAKYRHDPRIKYKNDAEQVISMQRIEFDFIVVGASAGGCVMSRRLTEARHLTTLTFEAGCKSPMICTEVPALFSCMWRSPQDWQYSTSDTKTCRAMQGGCYLPSGKTIGGTSSMNVMFAIRGSSHVYDSWEEKYNCNGWQYKDVLPYFLKSEGNTDPNLCSKYHCDKGPLKISYYYEDPYKNFVMNTLNEAGFPTVRDINIQHGPCVCNVQGSIYNGRRFSVAKAYLNPIQRRSNFKLFKCATITRILFKRRKAIGVEFHYKNKRYKAYARKEVILTAGSIGNSIILQQSGIGFQEDLDHNQITSWLPLPVGRYLQDHLACWQWFKSKGDTQPIGQLFSNIIGYYNCPRTLDFTGIGTARPPYSWGNNS